MTAAVRRREVEEQQPLKTGRLSPDKIRFRAGNRNLGDLRELAESLRQDGVLQPLLVHRVGDDVEVLDGHRRLAAARIAGLRTVPVVIVPRRSHGDAINIMVATAMHAKTLDSDERAAAINELVNRHAWTVPDLAARWGVTVATVQRWRAGSSNAASSPAPAHQRRAPTTIGVRKLTEVIERWEKQAGSTGLSSVETAALLEELRSLLPTLECSGAAA